MPHTIRAKSGVRVASRFASIRSIIPTSWWTTREHNRLMAQMERSAGGLRLHQDMHLMHEALCANVFAMRLASTPVEVKAVKDDVAENARTIHE